MHVGKEINRSRATAATAVARRPVSRYSAVSKVILLLALLGLSVSLGAIHTASAGAGGALNVWWPSQGAKVSGTQPFKAMVEGLDVSQYEMFWQVDGGTWNWMDNNYADYPHKEVSVDLSNWNWKGSGPYKVNFIARQNGSIITEHSIDITIENGLPQTTAVAPAVVTQPVVNAAPAPVAATVPETSQKQLNINIGGLNLYVNPNSPAARQANEWRNSRPQDAQKMDVLASAPTANWFGGWSGDIESAVRGTVSTARNAGAVPVLVAYNIPQRDCGGYSAGGTSHDQYTSWIGGFARGIGSASAIVILEPDALSGIECLSQGDQNRRLDLLTGAVSILKSNGNTKVYIDAGHSGWIDAGVMARRLERSNISRADGFALNVSNFKTTGDETTYGNSVSSKIGGKHFVIDTSRNGNGSNGEWCNPWGRSIGQKPTTNTGNSTIDAYLWIKTPGESDGNCNGGPSAGVWWPDYALSLVR